MRALGRVASILVLAFSSGASAHEKLGEQVSPGQLLKQVAVIIHRVDQWSPYADKRFGFTVDLPVGLFGPVEQTKRGISLRDPRYFVTAIEGADRIREVTYRAAGKNWFVLSGFYSRTEAGDAVIFYTKFMFSADHSRLAAFEISFPARQKPRFADAVERIEDTFSGPPR